MMTTLLWIVGILALAGLILAGLHWSRLSMQDSPENPTFMTRVMGGFAVQARSLRQIKKNREQQYKTDRAAADYQKDRSAGMFWLDRDLKETGKNE